MNERTTETLIGAVVLALAAAFFWYAASTTGATRGGGDGSYELIAAFRSADGVNVGTDVRMAGVKIGTVSDLRLDPETYRAVARLSLQPDLPIPDDSAALISQEGLLGGVFVEIVPGGSPFNLENGGEITDTQGSVSLITLLLKFVTGGSGE